MNRAFILSLFGPPLVVLACSGATLPVAENDVTSGCTGTAPSCFGDDLSGCCGQDPSGVATCTSGKWMCGTAGAPGCNGTSCLASSDAGAACVGVAPSCFGNNVTACCGQDPSGTATCEAGHWMCGSAAAPGCTGTKCSDETVGCVPACDPSQVCVGVQIVGGGEPFPDDAGNCPIGTVHAGDRCAPPPTYSCKPYPTACTSTLDCTCAASLCPSVCVSTTPGQVNCVLDAP